MARYLYLTLGTIFLISVVVVAFSRRDLRRGIITVALCGAVWGPISEIWFFRDYWHPQSALGTPFFEDLIYGAGISATAACVYKVAARQTYANVRRFSTRYLETGILIGLYIVAMLVLQMALGLNSIIVAIAVYVVSASYIVSRRRDLLKVSAYSAVLMGLMAVVGYGIGLNFVVKEPDTLANIWLLYKKPLGITILGYVPLTEVLWYTAWGSLLGVLYEFATGRSLLRLASQQRATTLESPRSDTGGDSLPYSQKAAPRPSSV